MNERDPELERAVRSLVDEGRAAVGPEPTEEELLAYHRGELPDDEADRFEERLAHYPEAAQLLAAFADEREPEPGDPDYRSEADRAAAWSALQERLGKPQGSGRLASSEPRALRRTQEPPAFRPMGIPRLVERLAAAGVILLLGALWYVQVRQVDELGRQVAELREPRINPESRSIADARRRGAEGERAILLPRQDRPYLLTLALYEAPSFPDYRLEIVPADEPGADPLWASSGLERRADDTFRVVLPGDYLPPGRYEVRLYGVDGARNTPVATYVVEV